MKQIIFGFISALSLSLICGFSAWASSIPASISTFSVTNQSISDLSINWYYQAEDLYGNVADIDHYNIYRDTSPNFIPDTTLGTNRIAQTSEKTYTDTDAQTAETNYFYYVIAVTTDGTESILPSPLGCKIRHDFTYTEGGSNTHWLTIPENDDYTTASNIGVLSPAISQVIAWDAATQTEIFWNSDGTGTDFTLQKGQPCGIVITADTVINLLGTLPAGTVDLVHNPDNFSVNWLSLPQPNIYSSASDLAGDIPNVTKISRYDAANSTYQSWFNLDGTWMGEDFTLAPGDGLVAVVTDAGSWEPAHGYPAVSAESDLTQGLNSLSVNLTGAAQDPGGAISLYEWDFEGDGAFDFSHMLSPDTSHTYSSPGTYYPTLVVTDKDGFKGYAFQTVHVYGLETDIALDGFNPGQGEEGSFTLNLTEDGFITLNIYDQTGTLVATPALNTTVTAGENTLTWGGTADDGQQVADGVYHAVLTYDVNGTSFTFDQRTTGGIDITGDIENLTVSDTLSPLSGEYTQINYTLPAKALVTISIKDTTGAVIRNLLSDAPRVSGPHTEIWDGMDNTGTLVAPSTQFFIRITAVSLSDNAILALGATPELSNVAGAPLRFSPAANPYGSLDDARVQISFNLNKTADVTAQVYNASRNLVRTITQSAVAAGACEISWNGRLENGSLAGDGFYTIQLSAADAGGNTSTPFTLQTEIYY